MSTELAEARKLVDEEHAAATLSDIDLERAGVLAQIALAGAAERIATALETLARPA